MTVLDIVSNVKKAETRSGSTSSGWAWVFLAVGLVAVAVVLLTAPEPRALVVHAGALAAIGAAGFGAWRHLDRSSRAPWWLIVAGMALVEVALVSNAAMHRLQGGMSPAVALLPKVAMLPAYVMIARAFTMMLNSGREARGSPARVDALIVGVGLSLIAGTFLGAPAVGEIRPSSLVSVLAAVIIAEDVLVVVPLVYLVLSRGLRIPALWLAGASIVAMVVADLAYLFLVLAGVVPAHTPGWLSALVLAAFVTMGASGSHPSIRTLVGGRTVASRPVGVVQGIVLALVIAAPVMITLMSSPGGVSTMWLRAVLTVGFAALIAARIGQTTAAWRAAHRAERWGASHDALTGLANEALLMTTLAGWCARVTTDGSRIELLLLDLDRFRAVNGTWGRLVGDETLRAVADRLASFPEGEHLVCRLGMDRFVIALAAVPPGETGSTTGARLIAEFVLPFLSSVGEVGVTASVGVSSTADSARLPQALVHAADTAMYGAKETGRNRWSGYDRAVDERLQRRAVLERAVCGAEDRGELSVHYQPIVDLRDDGLVGFEALMRWDSPVLGRVSPAEFIPIAEFTGAILTSGAWLLERAAEQTAAWNASRSPRIPELHVSVNVSACQLREPTLPDVIGRVLERTGLPVTALWLEITESLPLDEPTVALNILRCARELGVTLCVDDFGSGYSSLSCLTAAPAKIIKVDRALIMNLGRDSDGDALVHSVIRMAHALHRVVVAEGVETPAQRDWLRAHHCDLAQGYLYGRPQDASVQTHRVQPDPPRVAVAQVGGGGRVGSSR